MQLLTLVPNHLSTHKTTNPNPPYHTRIHHYSQLFTPPTTLHNKKPHQKWRGREKESGGEREKGEKECGIPQEKEKMRCREG